MAVYGPENNEELYHYGIKRKSGRYPWGSGKEPYQSNPAMAKKAASANASKAPAKSAAKVASASKNFSKRPETFWEKRRKAQAAKQREKAKAAKAKAEEEAKVKEAAKPATQKAKEMSDEELMRAINRLRLEQTYLSMLEPPKQNSQNQSQQQNNQQQQAKQQAQQIRNTVDNGKRWIDKMKSGTKDAADLATNIGNIAKGAKTTYANVMSIKKMIDAAEELKKKKG